MGVRDLIAKALMGNEGLAYLLSQRSKAAAIGPEKGTFRPHGISEFSVQGAPEGFQGNRLVYSNDGQIIGGMQVTRTPGGPPVVANTYVHPDYRRQGIATQLNAHAESLYGPLDRSEGPSEMGQVFRDSLLRDR